MRETRLWPGERIKPMADRFQEYILYFKAHPHTDWRECQRQVDEAYERQAHDGAAVKERQHYERAAPGMNEDEAYNAAIDYMRRHPYTSYEEAEELHGIRCMNEIPKLDAGGLIFDPNQPVRHDYARQPPQGRFSPAELEATAVELECSLEDAERFLTRYFGLIRDGHPHDSAWAHAIGHVFGLERTPRPVTPSGMESTPNAPVTHRGSSFTKHLGTWSAASSSNDFGPVAQIAAPAFKPSSGTTRKPQAIPRPEPGLSPKGYARQNRLQYYMAMGLPEDQARDLAEAEST
jgi:hypothetical protein